jgi:hypothetical protein
MPVMSVKAKARIAAMLIAAMFTVITPLQRCLGLATTLWGCRLSRINRRSQSPRSIRSEALPSLSPVRQFGTMPQEQEKSCALRHNRDWGRNGIIPGPQVAKR